MTFENLDLNTYIANYHTEILEMVRVSLVAIVTLWLIVISVQSALKYLESI